MAQAFLGLGLGVTIVALVLSLLFVMEVLEKAFGHGQLRMERTSDVPLPPVEQRRPEPSAAQELAPARAA